MSLTYILNGLAIIAALISAGLWFWASQLPAVFPKAYLSGPPPEIERIVIKQARLNSYAAVCTGIAVLLQAIANYCVQTPS
ncbi:MAG: hypothetical protein EOO29_20160 [Comamonadaceae bacterium]|nr:MAG: hypothetical protein EOO29_20160 [Comamonadaceae bacterium]